MKYRKRSQNRLLFFLLTSVLLVLILTANSLSKTSIFASLTKHYATLEVLKTIVIVFGKLWIMLFPVIDNALKSVMIHAH